MEGGTAFKHERLEIIIVGSVISVSTSPPTKGTERGMPNKFRNIARPSRPKITEGTAAKLLMFTSIKSVIRFLGAYSSRYTAAATPMGKDKAKVTSKVSKLPTTAPAIPAISGSEESPFVNKPVLNFRSSSPDSRSSLIQATCFSLKRSAYSLSDATLFK